MKVLLIILIFFMLTGLMLVNNHELHLADKEELKEFSNLYTHWVEKVYSNVFSVTGHVSKLDWLPK